MPSVLAGHGRDLEGERDSRQSSRFSRFRGTVQQGPARRQETQIVQSQLDLYDFPP